MGGKSTENIGWARASSGCDGAKGRRGRRGEEGEEGEKEGKRAAQPLHSVGPTRPCESTFVASIASRRTTFPLCTAHTRTYPQLGSTVHARFNLLLTMTPTAIATDTFPSPSPIQPMRTRDTPSSDSDPCSDEIAIDAAAVAAPAPAATRDTEPPSRPRLSRARYSNLPRPPPLLKEKHSGSSRTTTTTTTTMMMGADSKPSSGREKSSATGSSASSSEGSSSPLTSIGLGWPSSDASSSHEGDATPWQQRSTYAFRRAVMVVCVLAPLVSHGGHTFDWV